jgi:hypothetical protein
MRKVSDWIEGHQLVAFYVLTFAITWGLGFSYGAVMKRQQFLLAPLVMVATCGPALAGIIVTAIIGTGARRGKRRTFWVALVAAWIMSTLVMLANNKLINHAPVSAIIIAFTIVSVLPVAFKHRVYFGTWGGVGGWYAWGWFPFLSLAATETLTTRRRLRLHGRYPLGDGP